MAARRRVSGVIWVSLAELTEKKQMGDVPVPDVMDSSGRMKRLLIGLIAGVTAAASAYFISDAMAKPAPGPNVGGAYRLGADQPAYYMQAAAGRTALAGTSSSVTGRHSAAGPPSSSRRSCSSHARRSSGSASKRSRALAS